MNFSHISAITFEKPTEGEKPVDNLCAKNAQIVDLFALSGRLS